MRYEEPIFRPPSEAGSLILQATVGCSWNHCTYCAMYRMKRYRVRPLDELLAEVRAAGRAFGPEVTKLLLYVGPETGDEETFRRIAKGAGFAEHALAARRAHAAGMKLSAIFLLGAGGIERSREHAEGSARLVTEMDPEFLSLLTLTVVPGTPIAQLAERGAFELPSVARMLEELRTIVACSAPTAAVFRTNHASNYLALEGRLPRDRDRIVETVDRALAGGIALRPEWTRGL